MTIWNLGSINIDHVYRLPHMPAPGETLAASEYAQGLGGKGANQSVAAARAGACVQHIGAMGPGDDWVLDRLATAGVGTTHIARLPDQATGHAIILVDAMGENSIVIHPGANRALPLHQADFAPGDILLLQNETNRQSGTAADAQAKGVRVIYSAAPFDLDAVRAVLDHVSILAMNEHEARQVFDALGEALPVEGLLITRGGQGAEYRDLTTGETHRCPAFPVTPVDTTGAGDTFAGYFAAGLDAGLPVAAAMYRAAAAAAIKVTRPGAGDAIPDAAEVDAFLANSDSSSS